MEKKAADSLRASRPHFFYLLSFYRSQAALANFSVKISM